MVEQKLLISAICALAVFTAYLIRHMVIAVTDKLEHVSETLAKIAEALRELCTRNESEHKEQSEILHSMLKVLLRIHNGNKRSDDERSLKA